MRRLISSVYSTIYRLVLAGLAMVFPLNAHAQASAPRSFALTNVTIIDVTNGHQMAGQTVIIVGNRVHAIGPTRKLAIPVGIRVMDASGKYLIPGLWDMHVHPWRSAGRFYPRLVANGITGIRDAWTMVPLDTVRLWWREILDGQRVGPPRQLIAGPALTASSALLSGLIDVSTPEAAQHVVDSLAAAGANFLKVKDVAPDIYFAIAAAARRRGIPFGGHLTGHTWQMSSCRDNNRVCVRYEPPPSAMSPIEASDSGARIIDHHGGSVQACTSDSATVDGCRILAERFQRNGTWAVLTHYALTRFAGWERPLARRTLAELARRYYSAAEYPPRQYEADTALPSMKRPDSVPSFLRLDIMQRAGVPMLAGTDAPAFGLQPGFSLHEELATMVWAGLTPLHALQTATLNPARLLRGTDSLGTVAPGKLADLVLLDANPLENITNTTKISAVIANGRYFGRVALDALLAAGVQTAPAP